jgi:hypothetical protein
MVEPARHVTNCRTVHLNKLELDVLEVKQVISSFEIQDNNAGGNIIGGFL